MPLLSDEVSYEDVATLRDTQTKQIDEHDHVVAVRPGRQSLVADFVDEVGDDYLREAV